MASQGTAIGIHLLITRACGCVEDHGMASYSHPDPFIERHHLIDRLMNWHDHPDRSGALNQIKGMGNAEIHEHLKTLGPIFRPRVLASCPQHGGSAQPRQIPPIAGAANVETWGGVSITNNRRHGSGTEPVYIGYGSGVGTSARTDTTLFTEFTTGTWTGYARLTATASLTTTSQTNDTWKLTGTTTNSSGGSVAITNLGNFDASTSGNLDVKGDFATVNLANGDSISPTITLQET